MSSNDVQAGNLPQQPNSMRRHKAEGVIGVLALLLFSAVVTLSVVGKSGAEASDQQQALVAPTAVQTVLSTGTSDAPTGSFIPTLTPEGGWGIVVKTDGDEFNMWITLIPQPWLNHDQDYARYEITLSRSDETLETCRYRTFGSDGRTYTIYRTRPNVNVKAIDRLTGRQIAATMFRGHNPDQCPDTVTIIGGRTSETYGGTIEQPAKFGMWMLRTFEDEFGLVTLTPTPTRTPVTTDTPSST